MLQLSLTYEESTALMKVLVRVACGEMDVDEQTERKCVRILKMLNIEVV
ncbi:MAG: hypothetical protein M0R51_09545 [Clostridia bacterium]|jgi:hypothetical protein|nr:hypothetical protein [Clostridia bacterium]